MKKNPFKQIAKANLTKGILIGGLSVSLFYLILLTLSHLWTQ